MIKKKDYTHISGAEKSIGMDCWRGVGHARGRGGQGGEGEEREGAEGTCMRGMHAI